MTSRSRRVWQSTSNADVLGGAELKRARPRGFIESWNPQAKKLALLTQVQAVIEEYRDYHPLMIRQIYYRLVGAHNFPKTEGAYKNQLCELMTEARRARVIPFEIIRDKDDVIADLDTGAFASGEEFLEGVRARAMTLELDRTTGQRTRLIVWCEAAGMVTQLQRVATAYGIPVVASSGFDSLTNKYNFAKEVARGDLPVEVLHIGDHDNSGGSIFIAMKEDIAAFVEGFGGSLIFTRIAVTPAQIQELGLPTAPQKATDNRAFHGMTCQAEAIPPDVLARVLRDAIEERINKKALTQVKRREIQVRRELIVRLET